MLALKSLKERATLSPKRVVLPEGMDPRVIQAALEAQASGVCTPIVLGTPAEIAQGQGSLGVDLARSGIETIDYSEASPVAHQLAAALHKRRAAKGMTLRDAQLAVSTQRLYYGGMMVAAGMADGLVAGAVVSTGEMLRSAFHCIGTAPGIALASSMFFMALREPTPSGDDVLLFADCGVNPNPSARELVDIAHATALSYRQLLNKRPRLAFLSYSTKGSARHDLVDKMREGCEMTRERFAEIGLDALVDGELQGDAALVPSVANSKNPQGVIQGNANVLIFPDLQAGNIAYKLVERLAGATALGPILQGLARPVNDLSRGCSVEDIIGAICVTVLQSR